MSHDCDPQILAKAMLDKLGILVSQRDPRVLSEFTEDALLVGSEKGEVAVGRAQLNAFFQRIFERPTSFSWDWDDIRAHASGDLCWLFAQGVVVISNEEGQKRAPYRLSAVLRSEQGRWMWQLFHGSEPACAAFAKQPHTSGRSWPGPTISCGRCRACKIR